MPPNALMLLFTSSRSGLALLLVIAAQGHASP
jgi:hypothetical protein